MVSEYQAGRLMLDELVGLDIGLDEVNDAVRSMTSAEFARTVIVF